MAVGRALHRNCATHMLSACWSAGSYPRVYVRSIRRLAVAVQALVGTHLPWSICLSSPLTRDRELRRVTVWKGCMVL